MTDFLTSAQMRAIECAAIESGQVTGAALMERAGAGAVAALFAQWPDLSAGAASVYVLCGPGNNGGDGHVMARHLQLAGWRVFIAQDAPPLPAAPDALANFHRAEQAGCTLLSLDCALVDSIRAETGTVVVIDAVFGIGLTRPLAAQLQTLFAALNALRGQAGHTQNSTAPRFVAVDIPSGLCADTGEVITGVDGGINGGINGGAALRADLTITFHKKKFGHVRAQGPALCGVLRVVDIGLGPWESARHDT